VLDDLDQDIRERLASRKTGRIAAFTGTASYFCRRYGLDEVFVTGVTPGGGPGRTSLKGTVSLLRGLGVGAVFTGPLFPRQPAEAAASRAGVRLLVLEPFGAPGRGGYFEIMGHTLELIEEGLTRGQVLK
jgi:ABC-type Zn uptake system ZnuABC Zn-binding protein ZnuA